MPAVIFGLFDQIAAVASDEISVFVLNGSEGVRKVQILDAIYSNKVVSKGRLQPSQRVEVRACSQRWWKAMLFKHKLILFFKKEFRLW